MSVRAQRRYFPVTRWRRGGEDFWPATEHGRGVGGFWRWDTTTGSWCARASRFLGVGAHGDETEQGRLEEETVRDGAPVRCLPKVEEGADPRGPHVSGREVRGVAGWA
jgi:hypothetical protein